MEELRILEITASAIYDTAVAVSKSAPTTKKEKPEDTKVDTPKKSIDNSGGDAPTTSSVFGKKI